MSRPQSMPDFAALLETSTSLFEKRIHMTQNRRRTASPERKTAHLQHLRKKPSISLAAGLIMNGEMMMMVPKSAGSSQPEKPRIRGDDGGGGVVQDVRDARQDCGGNLFYAYAIMTSRNGQSDAVNSPPYILTFASAAICTRWWTGAQRVYPDSTRPSPQFFVMRSEALEMLRVDSTLDDIKNQWFCTPTASHHPTILPLQTATGVPIAPPPPPAAQAAEPKEAIPPNPTTPPPSTAHAPDNLADNLTRLASIVQQNTQQIHALSVAQSAGLQHMQDINETHSTHIKSLADATTTLQATTARTAHQQHHLATQQERLHAAHTDTHTMLNATATHVAALATQQQRSAADVTRAVDQIATAVAHLCSQGLAAAAASDTASVQSATSTSTSADRSVSPSPPCTTRMRPGPRKLNRAVKGVWYEYDDEGRVAAAVLAGKRGGAKAVVDGPGKQARVLKDAARG